MRRIYEKHRVDIQFAARIEKARFKALVRFLATVDRVPSLTAANPREVALTQWVAERSPAARIQSIVTGTTRAPVLV